MSVIDKFLDIMRLNDDDYEFDNDDYDFDEDDYQEEVKEMSGLDKTLASLSGFYYTDAEETSSYQ